MRPNFLTALTVLALVLSSRAAIAQEADSQTGEPCPHTSKAESSPAGRDALIGRGEKGMGFSQAKTTHHFLLKPDGGVIAVSANDRSDTTTRDQIRMHLAHIARAFSEGDFEIPMSVHDRVPPGVPVMKRLARDIVYRFKPSDTGGEVRLSGTSVEAVRAIHDFLVFQIREHKTGDPTN